MDILSAKLRILTFLAGVLIAGLAAAIVLAVISYFFGVAVSFHIISIIMLAFVVLDFVQWLFSPYIIGYAYRLTPVREDDQSNAWLLEMVSRLASNNNLKMPKLFIAEMGFPNAFAYSSPLAGKRVAVTRPLLDILDRDELEAVLAHEMGHLKHRDSELLFAIGLIPTLMFYLAYGLIFSGSSREQNGYAFLVAIALMVLSFVFNIMILGMNRIRESYADMNAVKTVDGGAVHLQTALAKIVSFTGVKYRRRKSDAGSSIATMLLFSDLNSPADGGYTSLLEKWKTMKVSRAASWFSSHPHPAIRIQMLEKYRVSY